MKVENDTLEVESSMKNKIFLKIILAGLLLSFGCSSNLAGAALSVDTETPAAPQPTFTEQVTETVTPTASPVPTLAPTFTATIVPTETEVPGSATLRSRAGRKNIQIGVYLDWQWFSQPNWRDLAAKEFNTAVIADGIQWNSAEAQKGQFAFETVVDEQVAFAQANQMEIVGNALLLGQEPYIPAWLAQGNYSKEQLEEFLRTYIVTVMSRYKGIIRTYVVVEDAPLPEYMQYDIFYQKFGYDYIDLAFQIARETDPTATLIYNANNNETADSPASALTHQIVERLKSKGLVDGVGFEMHLDARTPPEKAAVIAEMQSYGLPIHVTEIDVDLGNLIVNREERYAIQAKIYGEMLSACLESGVCESFSFWSLGDKFSWLMRYSALADPAPFDSDLNPKPAYFTLLDALR
jgi:endo-1,4-beta-xylanase